MYHKFDRAGKRFLGSEARMLGCYWFRGVAFAGDRSDHRGRMGAGAFCLGDPEMKQCVGVGREEEGTSSNRPEFTSAGLESNEDY